jgi:hypothetical protein
LTTPPSVCSSSTTSPPSCVQLPRHVTQLVVPPVVVGWPSEPVG